MARTVSIPHSWPVSKWAVDVYPNSTPKGQYIVRQHRKELILAGALSRVGRELVVNGARYAKWLEQKAADVPGYVPACNRNRTAA